MKSILTRVSGAIIDTGDCAKFLKALGDENRLEIVRQLMVSPKHVGDMNEHLGMEPTLLSHHLRVLKESGIVESTRDGKAVLYRLSPAVESRKVNSTIDFGCCKLSFDKQFKGV